MVINTGQTRGLTFYIMPLLMLLAFNRASATKPNLRVLLPTASHDRIIHFPPGDFSVTTPLVLRDMRNVLVTGDGVTLRASGPSSAFFTIIGSSHLRLTGFRLIGHTSATHPSTGSGPAVMIGSTDATETLTNHNVEIDHLKISGANWAGIMIYGRYGALGTTKNDTIRIHHNIVTDSSNGVFVYKNAHNVAIYSNRIERTGQDGIAIDTRAATDRVVSEANSDICVTDNVISNVGLSAQGIGVLVKGDNDRILVARNRIQRVGVQPKAIGPIAAGIALVPDFGKSMPRDIIVSNNDIEDIRPNSPSGYGLLADPGIRSLMLRGNTFTRIGRPARFDQLDTKVSEEPQVGDVACPVAGTQPIVSGLN